MSVISEKSSNVETISEEAMSRNALLAENRLTKTQENRIQLSEIFQKADLNFKQIVDRYSIFLDQSDIKTDDDAQNVEIGPNGTKILTKDFKAINWSTIPSATRSLLSICFDSDTLATHSLTGKPSPAFLGRERPPKNQLDPLKTADIIYIVKNKFKVAPRDVRLSITMKCADMAKKYKRMETKMGCQL